MVDLVSHDPRPLTNDTFYNHSLDWSPKGDEVLFSSYAGTEIKIDGEEFLIVDESEILAVLS